MRVSLAASLLAAGGGALAEQQQQQQQKPLGRPTQLLTGTRQRLSCEATYSAGWERCGDRVCRGFLKCCERRRLVAEL